MWLNILSIVELILNSRCPGQYQSTHFRCLLCGCDNVFISHLLLPKRFGGLTVCSTSSLINNCCGTTNTVIREHLIVPFTFSIVYYR
uniref:Secreted protein n=1 Tax=Heterorhabditis bacteriophora TaxID=37862 RepID=A0A1I7W6C2_HETBA